MSLTREEERLIALGRAVEDVWLDVPVTAKRQLRELAPILHTAITTHVTLRRDKNSPQFTKKNPGSAGNVRRHR